MAPPDERVDCAVGVIAPTTHDRVHRPRHLALPLGEHVRRGGSTRTVNLERYDPVMEPNTTVTAIRVFVVLITVAALIAIYGWYRANVPALRSL